MPRFLHTADLHLDSPMQGLERHEGAPVDELRGATRRVLERIVDFAIDEEVACLLIAGDLYDGDWKDYNTGLFFIAQMARLQLANIPVFVVAGNHDAESQITAKLRLPPNVTLFPTRAPTTAYVETAGLAIHGQSYPSRAVSADLSSAYPPPVPGYFNIGLLHTSLDGRPGHATYAPCTRDGLSARGYDYWALGHVHRHEIVARDPWILYPGNPQGRHCHETGPKGVVLVDIADGSVATVTHCPLDCVRWARQDLDLAGLSDRDRLDAQIQACLAQALDHAEERLLALRLRLTGVSPLAGALRAEREALIANCQALAAALPGGERLWLETVEIVCTSPPANVAQASDATLEALRAEARSYDAALDAARSGAGEPPEPMRVLLAEIAALTGKLPPALRAGAMPFDPTTPEALASALADAEALLRLRLRAGN